MTPVYTARLAEFPRQPKNSTSHLSTVTDPYVDKAVIQAGKVYIYCDHAGDVSFRFNDLEQLVRFIEELTAVATVWNEAGRDA